MDQVNPVYADVGGAVGALLEPTALVQAPDCPQQVGAVNRGCRLLGVEALVWVLDF